MSMRQALIAEHRTVTKWGIGSYVLPGRDFTPKLLKCNTLFTIFR